MYSTDAFAKSSEEAPFAKCTIQRNECGPDDVEFDVKYCGICHTDVIVASNENYMTQYPMVPGHEMSGVVTKVGDDVTKLKPGDHVGVGCISESCLKCGACAQGEEHNCKEEYTDTYNGEIKHNLIKTDTGYTFGGYSKRMTINQRFAIKIPDAYPLECAGPVFCAGITTYSPLKYFGAGEGGKRVGVVGIGGLGQMGIQLAVALGNEVTAISSSADKESACREMGVKEFILSTDHKQMNKGAQSLDLILNTISAAHQCGKYLSLLARNGTLVQLGMSMEPHNIYQSVLVHMRYCLTGSSIGGIPETQECMDFCAQKGIQPRVELITADKLDQVYALLKEKNDGAKRYVLDLEAS